MAGVNDQGGSMSAGTMEAQAPESAIARPDRGAVYLSRRSNLRLVLTARQNRLNVAGMKVGEAEGVAVEFRDGKLRVPDDGNMTVAEGRQVDAAEIREWLDMHHLAGNVEEGFWKVDAMAPPLSAAELSALQSLALRLDLPGLERCLQAERDGWARPDIVSVLEESVENVRTTLAGAEAAQQAAIAKALAEQSGK